MKSAAVVVLLLSLATIPLRAQEEIPEPRFTVLAIGGGERTWPVAINGQAVGFAMNQKRTGIQISARLGNGGGRAYVDAYLMTAIGPDATEEDEVAHTSFDLIYPHDGWVVLFDGLELDKGQYWLIIAKPRERSHSSLNWFVAEPRELDMTCGVIYSGTRSYTFFGDAAEYIPASKFQQKFDAAYGFQFAITAFGSREADCAIGAISAISETGSSR